jgi:hypothetical protein
MLCCVMLYYRYNYGMMFMTQFLKLNKLHVATRSVPPPGAMHSLPWHYTEVQLDTSIKGTVAVH